MLVKLCGGKRNEDSGRIVDYVNERIKIVYRGTN